MLEKAIMVALVLTAAPVAFAQSGIERHAWQSQKPLKPMSRTAYSITGPLTFLPSVIVFGKKAVPVKSVGRFWRNWGNDGQDHTAEIFELSSDPGALLQGNTLCGADEKARYVVVWESVDNHGGAVNVSVWNSDVAPKDANSEGLCGTFAYEWKP